MGSGWTLVSHVPAGSRHKIARSCEGMHKNAHDKNVQIRTVLLVCRLRLETTETGRTLDYISSVTAGCVVRLSVETHGPNDVV